MFEGKTLFPGLSKILITVGIFGGVCFGTGYGARYLFNERAKVKAKQAEIDTLKARDTSFVRYLTPAEQKSYQQFKDSANQRYMQEQAKTKIGKPF